MKLLFILLAILLIFFIPIPIKLNMYYSAVDYYIKLYRFTIISKDKLKNKKKNLNKDKPDIKKKRKFMPLFDNKIDVKSLLSDFVKLDLKFKPFLRINFSLSYSLNDAAKTAIFYGVLYQAPPLIYFLLKIPFNIRKFNYNVTPIFEDKFLLKIETTSIIFLSLANIIYMIMILFKIILDRGGDPLSGE